MDLGVGTTLGDRYRLVRPLARGGMGSIWIARHLELETHVAVKVIGAGGSEPRQVERFRREARAAAQLRGPHIVQVLDYGVESGVPFMVMELLNGEDLDRHVRHRGRLSLARSLEIVRPLCKALVLVHAAGLVHRDIKPANVFLARIAGEEVVKLVDFGLVRTASSTSPIGKLTDVSAALGSPAYMSPEQFRGEEVDLRSDLWSVGLVIFEMLTGRMAIDARNMADLHEALLHKPIPDVSTLLPSFGPIDKFLARALCRDPDGRFVDATEFLSAFEEAVAEVDELENGGTLPGNRLVVHTAHDLPRFGQSTSEEGGAVVVTAKFSASVAALEGTLDWAEDESTLVSASPSAVEGEENTTIRGMSDSPEEGRAPRVRSDFSVKTTPSLVESRQQQIVRLPRLSEDEETGVKVVRVNRAAVRERISPGEIADPPTETSAGGPARCAHCGVRHPKSQKVCPATGLAIDHPSGALQAPASSRTTLHLALAVLGVLVVALIAKMLL